MKPMQMLGITAAFSALLIFAATEVDAQRGGGPGGGGASRASAGGGGGGANRQVRASSGSNISTASRGNANVNRGNATRTASNSNYNRSGNRNVNTGNINTGNANVNVDNDCCNGGWGYGAHPVARGAAIATTAAVMGSYYSTLPGGCVTVVRVGINYSRCGSTWYQPIYSGANVQYQVVVEP
jgi:hypothetical protein